MIKLSPSQIIPSALAVTDAERQQEAEREAEYADETASITDEPTASLPPKGGGPA